MDCRTFRSLIDTTGGHPPADALAHAAGCPACGALLAAEARLELGFAVLKRTPRPPDLAPKIIAAARTLPPPAPPATAGTMLLGLLAWSSPFRSTVFYTVAALLLYGLSMAVVHRGQVLQHQKQQAGHAAASETASTQSAHPAVDRPVPSAATGTRITPTTATNGRDQPGHEASRTILNGSPATIVASPAAAPPATPADAPTHPVAQPAASTEPQPVPITTPPDRPPQAE